MVVKRADSEGVDLIDDIVDDIDALIGDISPADEPETGYDFDDPTFPRCPRGCGRHWHGMAVTERIEEMHDEGRLDPGYRYREDDSPVLCPAPDFVGPHRYPDVVVPHRLPDFVADPQLPLHRTRQGRRATGYGPGPVLPEFAEVYLRRGLQPPTWRSHFDPAALWPYEPREPHLQHARRNGYFWLSCRLCGNHFGGHEIVDSIAFPDCEPDTTFAICPVCTADRNGGRP